jgi:DNA-binding GntR family transcriptional regulator
MEQRNAAQAQEAMVLHIDNARTNIMREIQEI